MANDKWEATINFLAANTDRDFTQAEIELLGDLLDLGFDWPSAFSLASGE